MRLRVRMGPRDANEEHRASTPLELFFDLVFVVAVGQAASALHHGLDEGHFASAIVGFLLVFFAIWWAWMNFTWFASAYDTDDVPYRIAVFVIMVGVLILAAGAARAVDGKSFGVITLGYLVMRLAMIALWLRAALAVREGRATALRYAIGIGVLQVLWIARLFLPEGVALATFLVLGSAELAVPMWAEGAGRTNWHPFHIAERYGLFTIIVLGESILSATIGVQGAMSADATVGELAPIVIGGLVTVFAMWWIYFDLPTQQLVANARETFGSRRRASFIWGYGHYFVFASAAATGTGIGVAIDHALDHNELSATAAGLCFTVPVAIYITAVWALHVPYKLTGPLKFWAVPVAVGLILASSFTAAPVLLTGIVLAVLIIVTTIAKHRSPLATRSL